MTSNVATAQTSLAEKPIPEHDILGPEAWMPGELLADTSWVQTLTDEDRAELDAGVRAVKERGLEAGRFGRESFPLPRLRSRLDSYVDMLENGRGVVLLRGVDVHAYDLDDLKRLYWGLILSLGTPMTQNARGDVIGNVKAFGRSMTEKNVRGYSTNEALPPHCDPGDAVSLLCVSCAETGGGSVIASSVAIFNEIRKTHPEYLPYLFRGFHFDLRGEGATRDPDEVTRHPVPVYSWYDGRLSCRFNQRTIIGGQVKAGRPLEGEELAAVEEVGRLVRDPRFHHVMQLEPGDIQLLCNHSVLHYRHHFEDGASPSTQRHLLRIWFNLDEAVARRLEPHFAERHNTGPRGGIHVHEDHAGWIP